MRLFLILTKKMLSGNIIIQTPYETQPQSQNGIGIRYCMAINFQNELAIRTPAPYKMY